MFTDLQAATKRKAKGKTFSTTSCCLQKSEVKSYNEMHCTWVDATSTFFPPLAYFPALPALGTGWPTTSFPALSTRYFFPALGTRGQFNKTFTRVIYKCNLCFIFSWLGTVWPTASFPALSTSYSFFGLALRLIYGLQTNQYQIGQTFSKSPKTVYRSFLFVSAKR